MNYVVVSGEIQNISSLSVTKQNLNYIKGVIATTEKYQNGGIYHNYVPFTCYGKIADFCNAYLKKGNTAILTGRWSHSSQQISNGAWKNYDCISVATIEIVDVKNVDEIATDLSFNNQFDNIDKPSTEVPDDVTVFTPSDEDLPY